MQTLLEKESENYRRWQIDCFFRVKSPWKIFHQTVQHIQIITTSDKIVTSEFAESMEENMNYITEIK